MRTNLAAATALAFFLPIAAHAKHFVLDGYYGCARATNGHAYCNEVGHGDLYFQVNDDFLALYVRKRAEYLQAQQAPPTQKTTETTVGEVAVEQKLNADASETREMLVLFKSIRQEQAQVQKQPAKSGPCGGIGNGSVAQQAVAVLDQRIKQLQGKYDDAKTKLTRYLTSVHPDDANLSVTARKDSELFPKIPYYIPGTTETGVFWLEPSVSDTGDLRFKLKFLDPNSVSKVRATIVMNETEMDLARDGLCKVVKWSAVAHKHDIHRDFSKRAVCFPADSCPAEGQRRAHAASTEIDFHVYENGSTAGRIQQNKGMFQDGYNISVDSALLLEAYMTHELKQGTQEYEAGTATKEQLEELFK